MTARATIDLHCHILPGVDDGALDVRDSVAMGGQAARDGIATVCATPHIRHDHDVRIPELPGQVDDLNAELARRGLPVRVALGGEVAEPIVDRLDDDELRAVSIGGAGRWILLEPAAGPLRESLLETIRGLRERGFGTLVAHPERHLTEDLAGWMRAAVAEGGLLQATAATLAEGPASDTLCELAAAGLVHVLASDAHSSHGGRRLELSPAVRRLERHGLTPERVRWIAERAPAAILAGEALGSPSEAGT